MYLYLVHKQEHDKTPHGKYFTPDSINQVNVMINQFRLRSIDTISHNRKHSGCISFAQYPASLRGEMEMIRTAGTTI